MLLFFCWIVLFLKAIAILTTNNFENAKFKSPLNLFTSIVIWYSYQWELLTYLLLNLLFDFTLLQYCQKNLNNSNLQELYILSVGAQMFLLGLFIFGCDLFIKQF